MAGVSIGTGLTSGIDYDSLVTQLMQIEARPQTLLKNQLSAAQTDAAAYRSINTSFAALATAASALTGTNFTAARTATSSNPAVTSSASPTAAIGSSVTFGVTALAAAHKMVTSGSWSSATADVRSAGPAWPIEVLGAGDVPLGTIDVKAGGTLADAAAAINAAGLGLTATVVQLKPSQYVLQVAGTKTGEENVFKLRSPAEDAATAGTAFTELTRGADATLDLGHGMVATSPTNTFGELMTGVSVTVSAVGSETTISVGSDTDTITAKVQALVSAANGVLAAVKGNTGTGGALKGNYALTSMAGQVLTAVSSAVGDDGSVARAGMQLTRDGTLTFDATAFQAKLAADPALVQRLFSGTTGAGTDNVRGTSDDSLDTDGIGARLQRLAQQANDSVNGTLTTLAKGQDTRAKDLQTQIEAYGLRLTSRQASLKAQFDAMEKALGSLQNQSSWLNSQLASLPSWSNSDS